MKNLEHRVPFFPDPPNPVVEGADLPAREVILRRCGLYEFGKGNATKRREILKDESFTVSSKLARRLTTEFPIVKCCIMCQGFDNLSVVDLKLAKEALRFGVPNLIYGTCICSACFENAKTKDGSEPVEEDMDTEVVEESFIEPEDVVQIEDKWVTINLEHPFEETESDEWPERYGFLKEDVENPENIDRSTIPPFRVKEAIEIARSSFKSRRLFLNSLADHKRIPMIPNVGDFDNLGQLAEEIFEKYHKEEPKAEMLKTFLDIQMDNVYLIHEDAVYYKDVNSNNELKTLMFASDEENEATKIEDFKENPLTKCYKLCDNIRYDAETQSMCKTYTR